MAEKPASPFAGLDKALLRASKPAPVVAEDAPPAREEPAAPSPPIRPAPPKRRTKGAAPQRADGEAPAAPPETDAIDAVRQAIKPIGKEIYYVRVTPEEKRQVEDLIYTYKRQGLRTSVNEIGRIALNYLLADYQTHGEHSVLARVLVDRHA